MSILAAIHRHSLTALFALALSTMTATAQDSERAFFAGKTVRLVVGFGPGGSTSAVTRMPGKRTGSCAPAGNAIPNIRPATTT